MKDLADRFEVGSWSEEECRLWLVWCRLGLEQWDRFLELQKKDRQTSDERDAGFAMWEQLKLAVKGSPNHELLAKEDDDNWRGLHFDVDMEVDIIQQDVQDDYFEQELAGRLAWRDLHEALKTQGAVNKFGVFVGTMEELEEVYAKEFDRYGLNRLQIVKTTDEPRLH